MKAIKKYGMTRNTAAEHLRDKQLQALKVGVPLADVDSAVDISHLETLIQNAARASAEKEAVAEQAVQPRLATFGKSERKINHAEIVSL